MKEDRKFWKHNIAEYLIAINAPKMTEEIFSECSNLSSKNELLQNLNNMAKEKSTGNDGLEFYPFFWHDINAPFVSSFWSAHLNGELSSLK